uniref:Uncharacterized protein n=1 Tax=Strongyloides venezuelensis TaxID=75913 RepID=A0A0K0F125_STRVS
MKHNALALFYFFLLTFKETCHLATNELKNKVIIIVNEQISLFLKDYQIINALDNTYKLLYNGTNLEDVEASFADCLSTSFDADQMEAVMIFGIKILTRLGLDGMDIFINKTLGVLRPIIFPYMDKIKDRMFIMKKKNDDVLEGINEGYSMTITFATSEVITKAFCEFKKAFTEDEWNAIYPDYDEFFLMSNYINICN